MGIPNFLILFLMFVPVCSISYADHNTENADRRYILNVQAFAEDEGFQRSVNQAKTFSESIQLFRDFEKRRIDTKEPPKKRVRQANMEKYRVTKTELIEALRSLREYDSFMERNKDKIRENSELQASVAYGRREAFEDALRAKERYRRAMIHVEVPIDNDIEELKKFGFVNEMKEHDLKKNRLMVQTVAYEIDRLEHLEDKQKIDCKNALMKCLVNPLNKTKINNRDCNNPFKK